MERYIGLDAHARSCTLVVLSGTGKHLSQEVVETNGAALREAVRRVAGTKRICLEEGVQSAWLYEILRSEAEEVVVVQPPKRPMGPKDDARDAAALAESLRIGACLRRVYKGIGPYSELRAAVKSYVTFRRDVQRTKTRIMAIFHSRGLLPTSGQAYRGEESKGWIAKLPPEQIKTAELLLQELEAQESLWAEAEERLHKAAQKHRPVKLLQTVPAIGPIRAAQIVATVVTPHRFRTKRQFWAYCGLAIVTRSSADWVRNQNGSWVRAHTQRTMGLNRNRCAILKEVFKGAAHQVATAMTSHPLHHEYQLLLERGLKPNLALVTMARRLAAVVLAMWKNEEVYKPRKQTPATTAQG